MKTFLLTLLALLALVLSVPGTAAHPSPGPTITSDAAVVGGAGPTDVEGPGLYGFRWNPCASIAFRILPRGGYAGSSADIREAVHRIAAVTGLRFVQVDRGQPADLTFRWDSPATRANLAGPVVGRSTITSYGHDGIKEIAVATIRLDRTARLRHGFPSWGGASWGQVYLHELGHSVGLTHVRPRDAVMNAAISRTNHVLSSGDRYRLRRVGRAAGCIPHSVR